MDWDLGVCLQYECRRKQFRKPDFFNCWMDIRALYRKFYSRRPQGLHGALQDLGLSFDGRQHSGICDARNTASLIKRMARDGCILEITKILAHDFKVNARNEGMNSHVLQVRNNMPDKRPGQKEVLLSLKKRKSSLQCNDPENGIEADGNSNVISISVCKWNAEDLAEANCFREKHTSSTVNDHSVTTSKIFLKQASQKIVQKMKPSSSHKVNLPCKGREHSVGRYTSRSLSPEKVLMNNINLDSNSIPRVTSVASGIVLPSMTYSSSIKSSTTKSSVSAPTSMTSSSALQNTPSDIMPSTSSIRVLPSISINHSVTSNKPYNTSTTYSSSGLPGSSRNINLSKAVAQEYVQDEGSPQPSTSNVHQSHSSAVIQQWHHKSNNTFLKKMTTPASLTEKSGPEQMPCNVLCHSEVTSSTVVVGSDHAPCSKFQTPTFSRPGFLPASRVHNAPNTQFKSPLLQSKVPSVHTSVNVSAKSASDETLNSNISVPMSNEIIKTANKQIRAPLQQSKVTAVPMSSRISQFLRQRQGKTPLLHSKSFCASTAHNMGSATHQFKTPLSHFRSLPRLSASTMSIIPPNETSKFTKTPPFCGCGRRAKFHITDKPGPNQGRGFFACPVQYSSPKNCSFFRWEDQGTTSSDRSFAQISTSTNGHQVSIKSVQTSAKYVTPQRLKNSHDEVVTKLHFT
ncbi:uncharacterized protein LOC143026495 isoform X2 [Oratosquilla oratoria]|uniref:uncharacterized protein LOC143026495 isoform X2 n=1 Tax=Oratosquilla oratoria TaxID=337810 RepID=UPI003F758F1D